MRIKSIHVLVLIGLVMVVFRGLNPPQNALGFDVFGYYIYLPATFIYDDPLVENREWLDTLFAKHEPSSTMYQVRTTEEGRSVFRFSGGMAFFYAPFFFVAHAVAPVLGYEPDGLTYPYEYIITFGCVIYGVLGLLFFRLLLLRFFSDGLTSALLILIVAGTNHFQMTAGSGTLLTHNIAFLLYAMVAWATVRWHESPTLKHAILVGMGVGLAIAVRPSEMVLLLFPVLYNVYNGASLKGKVDLILQQKTHLLAAVITTILMGVPQMVYWKLVTGDWIYYSYASAGHGFEFANPFLTEFLFSFRKGWFLYTPLMMLSVVGMIHLWKQHRQAFLAILLLALAHLWFDSSYTCWWYAGGSFSSRTMLPAYALLAVPLGSLISAKKNSILQGLMWVWIVLAVCLNLFQTYQFEAGVISKTRMTKEFYLRTFGKTEATEEDLKYLVAKRGEGPPTEAQLKTDYFSEPFKPEGYGSESFGPVLLHPDRPYSLSVKQPYKLIETGETHFWLKVTADFSLSGDTISGPFVIVNHMTHDGEAYAYYAARMEAKQMTLNGVNHHESFYISPEYRAKEDPIIIYGWYQGKDTCRLDNLNITLYRPKNDAP